MFTGFTGIKSNSVSVDTVGDNLANLNTTAFKNQRTLFETLLYRTIHEGDAPSDTSGGTLPRQIGTGSQVAAIQRDFRQGSLDPTGLQSDLGVDGDGFFVLSAPTGENLFTRDGAFHLDATQTMVSSNGSPLQVFVADAEGNVDVNTLANLVVPLGTTSQAISTTEAVMDGRLDPQTARSAAGAIVTSGVLRTSSGSAATESTSLTSLVNAGDLPLFADGDELTIAATKGGVAVPETAFVVGTTGSTVGDLAAYLEEVLGINTDPATGGTPGVRIDAGALVIESNYGEINAIEMDETSVTNKTGVITAPFSFSTTAPATGEGVTTTFNVYDSLGSKVDVRLRFALESKSDTGTTWRFYAESIGDSDLSPVLGTGTVSFDPDGQFVAATGTDITIDRANEGSTTPVTFSLDLSGLTGLASPGGGSQVIMDNQNGAQAGIMTNYSIDRDGIVTAVYSNQLEQVLGQVALATFTNDEGLIARSENVFVAGPNSGDATLTTPQTQRAGAIVAGSLEQSNVEIAREFITLIEASTGISASSRVVRAADDLLQELLLLAR